jgi:hypothetical protein
LALALPLALLLLPALEARRHWLADAGLNGAYIATARPELSWAAVRTGTYQPSLEQYVTEQLGFRGFLIRLRNQLAFNLFQSARSTDIIVGRHQVLFQPGPIAAYGGANLLPEAQVRWRVQRLRAVQRELARHGVQLLLVLAPSKARFQPEDLPAHLVPSPGNATNYDQFRRALLADSVQMLDFNPVFATWKKTKPYPLFPSTGTHWSGYGATLAADSLLHQLAQLGGVQFPTVRTLAPPRVVHTLDSLRATDNDIGGPLNLLWPVQPVPLAYRRLAFEAPKAGQTRPSALFVGDSFVWGLMLFSPYLQREFADDTRIWYYNNVVHQPDSVYHDTGQKVADLNLRQQLESRRFVVLLLTEHNLTEREFGFTDQVYRLYHPFTDADRAAIEQRAQAIISKLPWEEQSKDMGGVAQRARQQAQDEYEQQTSH